MQFVVAAVALLLAAMFDRCAAQSVTWQLINDIYYAVPMSIAAVSLDAWSRLEDETRGAIEEAARETTQRQWVAMSGRVAKNFARMRQNGLTIDVDEYPPADIIVALRAAGDKSIADSQGRAGPQADRVLAAYRSRSPRYEQ